MLVTALRRAPDHIGGFNSIPAGILPPQAIAQSLMNQELFFIEPRSRQDFLLLTVTGELDLAVRDLLLRELERHAAPAPVVLDLSGAGFVDASIIGVLFQLAGQAHDRDNRLAIVDAQIPERSIWHMTRLTEVCLVCRSVQEASAVLKG